MIRSNKNGKRNIKMQLLGFSELLGRRPFLWTNNKMAATTENNSSESDVNTAITCSGIRRVYSMSSFEGFLMARDSAKL